MHMGKVCVCAVENDPQCGTAVHRAVLSGEYSPLFPSVLLAETTSLAAEELDAILVRCDSGIELALKRAKAWSKYAKDLVAYVEKRATLGEFTHTHTHTHT